MAGPPCITCAHPSTHGAKTAELSLSSTATASSRAADIFLVPLRDVPLFATFIPSKILEYLGARRPVSGEAERILREVAAAT